MKRFCISLILLIALTRALPAQEASWPKDGEAFLYDYLQAAAQKLGCVYTIEHLSPGSFTDGSVLFQVIKSNAIPATVGELVVQLGMQSPQYVFKTNAGHTNVVHVIEVSLLRNPQYGLNQSIDLDFSGALGPLAGDQGLVKAINARVSHVFPIVRGDYLNSPNHSAVAAAVQAKGVPVRDILTGASVGKIKGYLLWTAISHELPVGTITGVAFR